MTERDHLAGDPDAPETDDDSEDEDLFPAWFDEWTEPPPPPVVPWYRNVRVLGTLIGLAFLALLVSTVLLLTLNSPADFPTGPRIRNATTPTEPPRATAPSGVAPTPSQSSAASSTTATSSEPETTASAPSAEPSAPQPVPSPPPRVEVERDGSGQPEGPKINVTRPPMSFTPTSAPKR